MLVTHCGLASRLFWIVARPATPWLCSGVCERLSQDASVGRRRRRSAGGRLRGRVTDGRDASAEGLRGLVVKLGLHQFLNVRVTGHDPATEIASRFEREAA